MGPIGWVFVAFGFSGSCPTIECTSDGYVFTNTEFNGCDSTSKGGAVALTGCSKVTIVECVFSECTADDWGGAIYLYAGSGSTNDITGSDFCKCGADSGGAAYFEADENDDVSHQSIAYRGNMCRETECGYAGALHCAVSLRIEFADGNLSVCNGGYVSGIYAATSTVRISRLAFFAVAWHDGPICLGFPYLSKSINDNELLWEYLAIVNNSAVDECLIIFATVEWLNVMLVVSNSVFADNQAVPVFCDDTSVSILLIECRWTVRLYSVSSFPRANGTQGPGISHA
jgi:hypothetical protein